jgi:hypothetical protein
MQYRIALRGFLLPMTVFLVLTLLPAHGQVAINQTAAVAGGISGSCDAPGFPITICTSGSYKLTSDLTVPANTDGIDINAGDVTIDLNGFAIRGALTCTGSGSTLSCSGSSSGYGIESNSVNITVHGGTVRGFATFGVYLGGFGNIVDEVNLSENGSALNVGAAVVTKCTASKNGYGFSGTNAQLKGNTASSNQVDGFDVWFGTATDNVSNNNGRYGFRAVNSLVSNNEASGNGSTDVFDAGGLVSPGNNSCHGASC